MFSSAPGQDDLHIANKPPPSLPAHDSGDKAPRRPSALQRLSIFLRPSGSEAARAAGVPAAVQSSQPAALTAADKASAASEDAGISHGTGLPGAGPAVREGAASQAAAPSSSSAATCPGAACSSGSDDLRCRAAQAEPEKEGQSVQGVGTSSVPGVSRAILRLVEETRDAPVARLRESMDALAQLCHLGLSGNAVTVTVPRSSCP